MLELAEKRRVERELGSPDLAQVCWVCVPAGGFTGSAVGQQRTLGSEEGRAARRDRGM